MQESINKEKLLEQLKNKCTDTNNTIIEIKNMLEGINSRISEAEERISELEDKMVEINSEEQNKAKIMKRTKDTPTFKLQGSQKKKRKRKGMRKFLKRLQLKISPTWKRKQATPRGTKSPIQEKQRVFLLGETHTNQTNKDQAQRKNIKSSKGGATSNIQGKPHMFNS